ncbi:hypothetical protein OG203_27620 [Nocardia sp. NBC_01499]|uniref:hypothetical protein n=1 Tax=Nocardia sp. NBC_01499 TaxID=2903597 RepID=UPI00386FC7D0
MPISSPGSDIRAAISRLDAAIDQAEQDLASYKQRNQPTAAELQQLTEKASSGELGADMQAAAGLVSSGAETWMGLFSGVSAYSHLLESHVNRMVAEHSGAIQASIAGDGSFHPLPDDLYK